MKNYCSVERNIQILIQVLKANNIHKVVASPGATDVSLNISLQHDPWFEMYSEVDERGAAYLACGIAAESQEPVVITCTGATSSRNYMPGLTEAYYRKLPILAVTCCRNNVYVGQLIDQVTDRSNLPNDVAMESVHAQAINTPLDELDVTNKINKAVLGLFRNGGGPCHINLETQYKADYSVKEIPMVRCVKFYTSSSILPIIPVGARVGIFVGAHEKWSRELTNAVTEFCKIYDSVVLCDHTSNYKGEYRVHFPLMFDQVDSNLGKNDFDLIIHIGYISNYQCQFTNVWRVNPDGEMRNTFGKLRAIFQLTELQFFNYYIQGKNGQCKNNLNLWKQKITDTNSLIPELPFSNIWVAQQLASKLPKNSVLHLGIRNSVRSWNYFDLDESILGYCNTGGFGIDGGVSSLIGASFCNPQKLYFGVFGDLLFFYNMNAIGNRDIKSNVRILIINNGLGQEFRNYSCNSSILGDEANLYVAAQGHFGNKSKDVVKSFAESLGFYYLAASNKEEFNEVYPIFVNPEMTVSPMIFEVFTNQEDESNALLTINTLSTKSKLKIGVKNMLNRSEMGGVKNIVKKVLKK